MKRSFAAAGVLALFASLAHAQQRTLEAGIPAYARTSGVSGNVNSVGSDTMNNLMTLWAEAFIKMYPNVKLQVEGKGTGDRFGIGYSGIGYKTSGVKVLALAEKDGAAYSDGNYADVKSGKYPLNRFLYLYINKARASRSIRWSRSTSS